MELDYTWVSSARAVNDPNDLIKAYGPQGQDQLRVSQIQPTANEVIDLRKDEKTVSLTPTMPMRLIEPIASTASRAPVGTGVAWGVELLAANQSRFDGQGAVVAVLDTGIASTHMAFARSAVIVENFTSDDNVVDANGHGTHCAGTVAGDMVDGIRIGIAPGIDKLLCGKVLTDDGQGSTTAIVKGVQWASMQGAQVISMSLGIDFPGYVENLHKMRGLELKAAVSLALQAYVSNIDMFSRLGDSLSALSYIGQGSLLIGAAGNESKRPHFTIGTSPPAVASSVVSVSAIDQQMQAAEFSNTDADVCAPGVDIASAGLDGGIAVLSGTSMAAPHVAGVAALWVQKFLESDQIPGVEQLKSALYSRMTTAANLPSGNESDVGRGLVLAPLL
ncbi:MAG: S8 family serine peptidase [Granulosicoccus sp.]|nr:S8 family serine peptidase [Granulosicoccus sp.]